MNRDRIFAVLDIENRTVFSLEAIQTLVILIGADDEDDLIDHYLDVVLQRGKEAKQLNILYIVVDGYFAKQKFVKGITANSHLHMISKFRHDANLRYVYNGSQKKGREVPNYIVEKWMPTGLIVAKSDIALI